MGNSLTFNLIVSGLIVVAAVFAMIGVRRSLGSLKRKLPKTDVGKVGKWARLGIIIVAALLILNLFDTPLDAFIQAIGAVCAVLAIGFVATWSTLSNFPCTFYLILTKPFSVGDELEIPADEVRGKVVDITLAYTVLQDAEGFHVNIPNAHFLQKQFRRRPTNVSISLAEQLRKSDPVKVATPVKPTAAKPAAASQESKPDPKPAASVSSKPAEDKKATIAITPADSRPAPAVKPAITTPAPEKKFKVT